MYGATVDFKWVMPLVISQNLTKNISILTRTFAHKKLSVWYCILNIYMYMYQQKVPASDAGLILVTDEVLIFVLTFLGLNEKKKKETKKKNMVKP